MANDKKEPNLVKKEEKDKTETILDDNLLH